MQKSQVINMKLHISPKVLSLSSNMGRPIVPKVRSAKSLESVKQYGDFTTKVLSISIDSEYFSKS